VPQVDLVNLFHPPDECKELYNAGKDPEALDLVGSIKEMRSCVFTGIKKLDCDPNRGYHVTRIVNPQLQTEEARKRCKKFTKEVLKDCNEEGCRAAVGL